MPSARALRFGKAVIELSLLSGNVEKGLKRVQARMRDFGTSLTSIGTAGIKASAALGGMLGVPLALAAGMEKTRAEFTALIGDAGKANDILSQIEGFALATPFSVSSLSDATRTMLGFGVAVNDLMPTLRRLGEISGGDEERLGRLALAFGQVTSKGRLMAQEVNQMVESGFNPLQEISRTTGESMASLMKKMEGGGISVADVAKAFETSTSAGGRFNGLLGEIAGTAIGKWNEMRESLLLAIRPLGDAMLPKVKELMEAITSAIPPFARWLKQHADLAVTLGKVLLVLGPTSVAFVGLGVVVKSASTLMMALIKAMAAARIAMVAFATNPIIAALTLIGVGVLALADKYDLLEKAARAAVGAMSDAEGVAGEPKKPPEFKTLTPEESAEEDRMLDIFTSGWNPTGMVASATNAFKDAAKAAGSSLPAGQFGATDQVGMMSSLWAAWFKTGMAATRARGAGLAEQRISQSNENQTLDDELARARIDGIKDETERRLAMLALEHQIRTRELEKEGLLNDEMRAKLSALFLAESDLIQNDPNKKVDGRIQEQQSTFDTRFAGQMFGGGWQDKMLTYARRTAENTGRNQNADGGLLVV